MLQQVINATRRMCDLGIKAAEAGDKLQTENAELKARVVELEREVKHWKANHDNRVIAARFLVERTDLSAERVSIYKHYLALLEKDQKTDSPIVQSRG